MASKADRVDSPRDPKQGESESKLKPRPYVDKVSTECKPCDPTRGSCITEGYRLNIRAKARAGTLDLRQLPLTWAGAMVPFNNRLPTELCILLALA